MTEFSVKLVDDTGKTYDTLKIIPGMTEEELGNWAFKHVRRAMLGAQSDIQPWDSDHTALVHVLWQAEHNGLSLDRPDDLAQHIMTSRWMQAVRLHADSAPLRQGDYSC
jgi:hypothetical protein